MIEGIADPIVKWLEKSGAISESEYRLHAYAIRSLLFGLAPVVIVVTLGMITDMIYEGLIMILPFMLIRKFSGGFHLTSPRLCFILSVVIIGGALAFLKYVIYWNLTNILTCLATVSLLILCFFSPIDSAARRLSIKEKQWFGRLARIISLSTFALYIYLIVCGSIESAYPIGMGIIISASLQIPCLPKYFIEIKQKTR